MVEIADFETHAPVPSETIEEYRGRVPDELVEIWETYGYGTFGLGFLRVIDPKLYEAEVGDCIGKDEMLIEHLKAEIFAEAIATHGELPYDQSFIFVPLLSLGGAPKVENLKKRQTITAIEVAVEFQGVVEH